MARRARDAEATRRDILNAAEKLFIKQGFGSTSLAQISAACHCANSLIVHHFGNKNSLWSAVKDRAFESFVAERTQIFSTTPVSIEDMRETARAYFRLLERNPGLVRLLLRAELEQDQVFSQYNEQQLGPFVRRMHQGQDAGLLRNDVPAAHLLLILINVITRWFEARHMVQNWEELGDASSNEAYLESVLDVFFDGALPRPVEAGS